MERLRDDADALDAIARAAFEGRETGEVPRAVRGRVDRLARR